MPHVCFVALSGVRVVKARLLKLGMTLPGLKRRAQALAALPALGVLTLAGLTPEPWTCSYHESSDDSEALLAEVAEKRPTLIAITALTASINQAYRFCARLRAAGFTSVVGGLHASAMPDEAALHADCVVVGEAEGVWPGLLADALKGELKPRYVARAAVVLAETPLPRFDLLGARQRPRYTLQTERGCPLACEFCGASRMLGPFREKPAANIVRELAQICALSPRPIIELADDNTFVGKRDHEPLFSALAASGARWFTESDWRIGERPELLARMAETGCVQVLIGVESPNIAPSGMGPKEAEPRRVLDAIEAIQDAGVAVNACFIAGVDGETPHSLARLAEFARDWPSAEVQVTLQTPFPGTPLRKRLTRQGRLLDRSWDCYTLFDVTFAPDAMSVSELERGYEDLIGVVYSREAHERRARVRRQISRHTELQTWE